MDPDKAVEDGGASPPGSLPAPGARAPEPDSFRLRYQEAFEFAPDCQLVTDGHGLILKANHAATLLLRCPKEFLGGKPLGLFVAEGHRPQFYNCLTRLGHGTGSDWFETRLGRRGEDQRYVVVLATVADGETDTRGAGAVRWVIRDVTTLRRAEADRTDLLARLVTAQEDERRRIARELHDSVGQLLVALTLTVKAARVMASLPPAVDARLDDAQRVADELGRTVHDLAVRLRPTSLDDLGLNAALAQHLSEWSARAGVEIDYQPAGIEAERLPPDVETAIYRVVQEALTNVARHARARSVSVVVGRHNGSVTAVVEDDGVGFDPEVAADSPVGRLGLVGMRERTALCGGTFDIESRPGCGTAVIAQFPVSGGEEVGHE
jgi:PAS domain S-box-containing protein